MAVALHGPAFTPLPLTSIMPTGWLKQQLRIQADGLSGHLCEFWPDVKESQWFGGRAEGWERAPYWLDGAIPLAFLLEDEPLKAKVTQYTDYIIRHQADDGWLGPRGASVEDRKKTDLWGQMLMLKVLAQYDDVAPAAGVPQAIHRWLMMMEQHIGPAPLFNWAMFRSYETLIPLLWLFERTKDAHLLELARRINCQGFDWAAFYRDLPQAERKRATSWTYSAHLANTAMMLKFGALLWRLTGQEDYRRLPAFMLDLLDEHHGQASGVFSGDECLAGKDPVQGTELCAVVEMMYSLEVLTSILGEPRFADRLELVAFNALPATLSPDMWTHQYDQQANQVSCTRRSKPLWTNNGPEANMFGLEPHYGCCTANLSQAWPKFVAHLWMAPSEGGLAAISYAPCKVKHNIGGAVVEVDVDTQYPFREDVRMVLRVDRPTPFPLLLRIPAWARGAVLCVDGVRQAATPGMFCRIERIWQGQTEIKLRLPMHPIGQRRFCNSLSITRGPLVYALKIGEEWTRHESDLPNREHPHCDYEVRPTTAWNYALDADAATLEKDLEFVEHPLGDCPFSPEGAPVSATVRGRRLPQWQDSGGDAVPLPTSPAASDQQTEQLTLIPYGCTNLRITEFPTLK